ncbi:MAG: hypothetical protein DWQ37_14260 [Planctomycetota bacterium]|nr:MAG: hypothetical protein DWQ37_14260 [Planctomycetota bacterium]
MEPKSSEKKRLVSLPSLIGWLSVCLLAAAYGRTLDERWQVIWAEMGAFGLVAAVGLGSIERIRLARQQKTRDKVTKARFETGLARLNQHSATIDSINAAVRKLAHQATLDTRRKLGHAQRNRRRDQMEMLADYPLTITPVDAKGELGIAAPSTAGSLQQISSRVVSFEHAEPIPEQTVLLTFHLGEQQRLSFVVDVTWTRAVDDGFASGGTVLAVGVPSSEPEPVAS